LQNINREQSRENVLATTGEPVVDHAIGTVSRREVLESAFDVV